MRVIRSRRWCALAMTALAVGPAQAQAPAAPFDRAQALAALRKSIEGKEDQPAVAVFMNIKQDKGVTAGRLLRIMEFGFSQSLGVTCTHCHVPGQCTGVSLRVCPVCTDGAALCPTSAHGASGPDARGRGTPAIAVDGTTHAASSGCASARKRRSRSRIATPAAA